MKRQRIQTQLRKKTICVNNPEILQMLKLVDKTLKLILYVYFKEIKKAIFVMNKHEKSGRVIKTLRECSN